jgi:hypothetical protein
MSIKELTDEDILDFLMTSDFEDNYSPDELKYLLHKWRYFYRLFNGRFERYKTDSEFNFEQLSNQLESINKTIINLQVEVANRENTINSMKSRKLTWKERFSGRIISTDDGKKL